MVRKLCELGATDREVAEALEVDVATVSRWKVSNPAFCEALKAGKEASDSRVVRSLFNRAVGYSFDSEKIVTVPMGGSMGSEVRRIAIVEHVAPDVTAQIFWLKNRRPDLWRDRQQHEHSGPDGAAIPLVQQVIISGPQDDLT